MILLSGHSLTPAWKVQAEEMSLTLNERESTASFTPTDMTGISVGSWLKDDREPGVGIVWRVKSIAQNYLQKTPKVSLEHAVATLKDRILFGKITAAEITGRVGATTCTAREAVTYILSQSPDWTLGTFDYGNVSNPYKFDGQTLYDALEMVSDSLADSWWSYDFSVYPFKLNITEKSATVGSVLRAGRNLTAVTKTIDTSGMYTRFYPIGKDDLHVSGDYVSKNENLYGVVAKVEVDQSLETTAELTAWANERLDKHAEPTVTINVNALELAEATGESLDKLTLGTKCRIPLPEFGAAEILETITQIVYQDKINTREVAQITLANTRTDVTRIIADAIKKGGAGGRGSARQQREDHAWFEDTNDHVAMCAEGIVGVDASGNPNWYLLSQIIVDGTGIHQTVEEVQNDLTIAESSIEQNSEGITSLVQKTGVNNLAQGETLYSKQVQTATEVSSMVVKTGINNLGQGETLYSKIQQSSDKISLVVKEVSGHDVIDAASITLAINSSGSGAYISADHVYISGSTRINDVFTVISNAVGVTVPMICSSDLTINSNGDLNVYDINLAGSNPVTLNAVTMANAIKKAEVTGSGANMTLTLTPFVGDPINFTKAATTSLTASWSGGTITVEAQPSGTRLVETLNYRNSDITWSGNTATVPVRAVWGSQAQNVAATGFSVSVDASARYTAGYDSAHLSGSWGTGSNSNLFTVTKVQSGSSNSLAVRVKAAISYDSSTHKYTAKALANDFQKDTAVSGTEAYTAGVNAVTVSSVAVYGSPAATATAISVQATASNGATKIGSISITSQRNNAYNSGVSSVTIPTNTAPAGTAESATITATASNGATKTCTVTAANAGFAGGGTYAQVKIGSTVIARQWVSLPSSATWSSYWPASNVISVTCNVGGKAYTQSFTR